jgi:hypothetical protein
MLTLQTLIGVCWSLAGTGRAATVSGHLSRPLHSIRRDRAGIQSQVSIIGMINVDTPSCEQWARCSVCIPPQWGLPGTLEGSGAALELSQMIPGPAQRFWGSQVFLLLNWQMSRGAPGMYPRILKKTQIPGGFLWGCQPRQPGPRLSLNEFSTLSKSPR